ncbi:MAG: NAD(P)/FAD-dependent oxidoreductase [Clostridia bacterium]|nr:NAD(P)/FAD-dependent oxidoreductase [Clostridia bacterium]
MEKYDVIVIGGGPAGMMAAGTAANNGKRVLLIEKNDMLGRKLRITGKGRCNITNTADDETFFDNLPKNSKFMFSSYYNFNNYDVIDFFNTLGVETVEERGGRVFPKSEKAIDVVNAMIKFIKDAKVSAKKDKVVKILAEDNTVCGVKCESGEYFADNVIIATGGRSYPLTGSTGDGYRFAKELGHTVTEIRPSLVPVETKDSWCRELQGLSLRNISIKLVKDSKEIFSDFGEMIFTHFGVSGPVILSASAHITDKSQYKLILDLKPALDEKTLDKRILRDFESFSNKNFSNALDELLPKKLIPVIVGLSGISPYKKVNMITKEERETLLKLLKNLTITVKRLRPIDEAIVTRGGIAVNEINPSTMESKLVKGLYFCGEVIDVDAYTGGYNLQIAFSTGRQAGESI